MKHNLKMHQEIYFQGEDLPMKVMAVSDRYVICTRALNWIADNGLLMYKVEMQAYMTKKQAYHDLKAYPVYSILDFEEIKKAPDNFGGKFDYSSQKECDECIAELLSGETELSQRHGTELKVDWYKTMTYPALCPHTGNKFFMLITTEAGDIVPTYGGPLDSYTIPEVTEENGVKNLVYERYCHDDDCWKGTQIAIIK